MSKEEDDSRLATVVNAIVAEAGEVIATSAERAYSESRLDQLVASYMTILALKHNVEGVIDEVVTLPTQFKFDCLDALIEAISEE
jgi:hypothetical protein